MKGSLCFPHLYLKLSQQGCHVQESELLKRQTKRINIILECSNVRINWIADNNIIWSRIRRISFPEKWKEFAVAQLKGQKVKEEEWGKRMIIFSYVKSKSRDVSHLYRRYHKKEEFEIVEKKTFQCLIRGSAGRQGDSSAFLLPGNLWEQVKKSIINSLERVDFT